MPAANDIRKQFIDFFVAKHGHTFVPSSPVVPYDDPTLLFTNAGMNQFKPIFLGAETRPYKRVANTQKCIRAGGKQNDLDDVGKDTYHHTFFEMLGNWSFGDYFKKEAIAWAWELLTKVWGLDKSRLHVTVFEGAPDEGVPRDDEAFEYWKAQTDIDHSHIHFGSKKDNFWEMGDTGPCGPCSEIHYDRTPDKSGGKLVNAGRPEVMEIWNLVFIQFNSHYPDSQGLDLLKQWDSGTEAQRRRLGYPSRQAIEAKFRKLSPLPAKHVDTGMGFERITAVLEGKDSNYDTDVFTPIFEVIYILTRGEKYTGKLDSFKDTAYRVVADHVRALTFALTDGATIGNEGRDYVLKRILRRAERYGRQYLGAKEPFLCDLVPAVVEVMGGAFPELKKSPQKVADAIREEEKEFIKTLDRGIRLFQDVAERTRAASSKTISGADAFKLHDTYGIYIDITEQMASEAGLGVDRTGYEQAMDEAKRKARGARKKLVITAVSGDLPRTDESPKYQGLTVTAKVLGWVKDNAVVTGGKLNQGDEAALLLNQSNFYAEQGGQVGDVGTVVTPTGKFEVDDTQKLGDSVLHVGRVVEGKIEVGETATLEVDPIRYHTMRNHTSTHLLNWGLRKVLRTDIDQKGSLVDPDKTRFDFSYDKPLTAEQVAEVEQLVNEKICLDLPVKPVFMPLAEAKKIPGVRAVFGEKYPDPVRVLLIGADKPEDVTPEHSVEFCGGTHLKHTGEAGFFKIVGQEAVGKGVRRVTAVTGRKAVEEVQKLDGVVNQLTGKFRCQPEDLPARIGGLEAEIKKLQQQLKKGSAADLQGTADKLLASASEIAGSKIIVGEIPEAPEEQVRQQVDRLRQKAASAVVVLGWTADGKVGLLAAVTDDLVKKGGHAGKLVGQVAKVVGGGGGGKPTLAQAGGKDPEKLAEALELAKKLAAEQLG